MVKDAVTVHEKAKTIKILKDPNRSKKLWENIDILRNDKKEDPRLIVLYKENGETIELSDTPEELENKWKTVYQKHENKIAEVWNPNVRLQYENNINEERVRTLNVHSGQTQITIGYHLREHFDMAIPVNNKKAYPMEKLVLTKDDMKKQLTKMKNGKAAGTDGIKPDFYKALTNSNKCITKLAECQNKTLQNKKGQENWKESRTTLVPKKSRPTVLDLRPIAILNNSCKIFMGAIKTKIEEHLQANGLLNELQTGFTGKRRTTDNIFLLDYCLQESYKMKKELYVISVDLQKAFDSIERGKLIEALMELNIDANIIEVICDIYSHDTTSLYLNQEKQVDITVSSGIRQGCNGSTVFFLIITYLLIRELEENQKGFKNEHFHIPALLYADDGLILTHSETDAQTCIQKLENIAATCGLALNKQKSNVLIFNKKQEHMPQEISGIKNLGIKITNKKACFKDHIKTSIEKAKKLGNTIYSVIETSCNRLLIGKTYWKGLAMPSYLYGSEVLVYREKDLEELQRTEHKVYRAILQLPSYTAVAALRADVGASSSKARDMKSKILYAKHAIDEDGNEN